MTASSPLSDASSTSFDISQFSSLLSQHQERLCAELESLDGHSVFSTDPWHSSTGHGLTRVLQGGHLFEKAGVNTTHITGHLTPTRAATMASRGRHIPPNTPYSAAALSFVVHAQSPFIPTLRGDVRVFMADGRYWAGGGVDLTVFYVDREVVAQFHRFWKRVCDAFDTRFYPDFKKNCDDYFYIPAREEYRGVGGLFYDDLVMQSDEMIRFQTAMLDNFLQCYAPILEKYAHKSWNEEQKRWQRIRRGRYLEFNLLNDRGVRFGLASPTSKKVDVKLNNERTVAERTDSIMISAPPSVEWPYNYVPKPHSPEEETVLLLKAPPLDWVNY